MELKGLREVERSLEKLREVNTVEAVEEVEGVEEVEEVEVVEEFFEKNHASKFIRSIILGC